MGKSEVNHIDETSHSKKNVLQWLWVMANTMVAFFMVHSNRFKEAFKALIGDWVGFLVSDGYGFPFDRPLLAFAERILTFVDWLLRLLESLHPAKTGWATGCFCT